MPRRLLPRPPSDLRRDKRGQILVIYGLVWIALGYNIIDEGDPITWSTLLPFQTLPPGPRGLAWIVTGALAIAYAIRPRVQGDGVGFLALYLMPAWRVVAFTWAWIDTYLPLGGPGYPSGWLWALTYAVMVASVMVCASWPNPPAGHGPRGGRQ